MKFYQYLIFFTIGSITLYFFDQILLGQKDVLKAVVVGCFTTLVYYLVQRRMERKRQHS